MTEERKNRLIELLIEEFGDPIENKGMFYCLVHAEKLNEISELIIEYKLNEIEELIAEYKNT